VPRWIQEELKCACGVIDCPEKQIGFLGPTPCATAEEWEAEYAEKLSRTPEQHRADQVAWEALHGHGFQEEEPEADEEDEHE
jgi:hypothetical protein